MPRVVAPIRNARAILSACTHYVAVLPALYAALPRLTTVIDPARALVELHFSPAPPEAIRDRYWTTGDPATSRRASEAC